MLIETKGKLQYGPGLRAVIWLDNQIGRYYSSLIPKYKDAQPQMYPTHITVVRTEKEKPIISDVWGRYNGEIIEIQYENVVREGNLYFWLDAYSDRIGKIREELGLTRYRPSYYSYHITLANKKKL